MSVRQKILVILLTVSLLPLAAANIVWLNTSQHNLEASAASQQSLLVKSAAQEVDHFISDKVANAIIHSQAASIQQFRIEAAQKELKTYLSQDADLSSVALIDARGMQELSVDGTGVSTVQIDRSGTDAFKVVTFLSGTEYLSPVQFDNSKQPYMTLSVPLISFTTPQLSESLSTSESGIIRSPTDIKGALIVTIQLGSLWQTVLSSRLGQSGYAYVVDDKGQLIAHPDTNFMATHHDLHDVPEVAAALASPDTSALPGRQAKPTTNKSETGVAVLSSYFRVTRTHWIVIAEEPVSSVYAKVNEAKTFGLLYFLAAALGVIILISLLSRSIIDPIQVLTEGSRRIGGGELQYRIPMDRHDEFGSLAKSFNDMATSLGSLIRQIKAQNSDLKAQSAKLETVLNTMADGIIALGDCGQVMLINAAVRGLVTKPEVDLVGQNWLKVFPFSMNDQVIKPKLDAGVVKLHDLSLINGDRTSYVNLTIAPIDGDPMGIRHIVTVHDVTQSRDLENMKMDFVSMAAHELRTPLTAVRGYIAMLEEMEVGLTPQGKTFLDRAAASSLYLVGLISNLLNFSKIERGALSLIRDRVDWKATIATVVGDQMLGAKDKGINIITELPQQPISITGDAITLREVLSNLIVNAVQYTPAGGTITVKVTQVDNMITTQVSDTGIGIPADAIPNMFGKYFRVTKGLATNTKGTGLGLYISKSIVEMHNGTINVTSTEGRGTTFTFTLPAAADIDGDAGGKVKEQRFGWIKKNTAS